MTLYERYQSLKIDKSYINLEEGSKTADWFCTPIGTKVIGWENGIHYCFIDGFGEMVFAVNPEGSINEDGKELHVYPLAENFEIFLRLIITVKCANHIEQIIHFTKSKFESFCTEDISDDKDFKKQQQIAIDAIKHEFQLTPLDNPYDYVKDLQKDFDYVAIHFTNEYYDTLGIERPNGTTNDEHLTEFDAVAFCFEK